MANQGPPPTLVVEGPIEKAYFRGDADTSHFNLILQVFEFFTNAESGSVLHDRTAFFCTTQRRYDEFPSADLRLRLREHLVGSRAPPVNIDDVVENIISTTKDYADDPEEDTGSLIFKAYRHVSLEEEVFDAVKTNLLASKWPLGGPMRLDLDSKCIVCAAEFVIQEDVVVVMPCRLHLSHKSCAKAWCHLSPGCRFPLPSRNPDQVIASEIANSGGEGGDSNFHEASSSSGGEESSSSGGEESSSSKGEGSSSSMPIDL